MKKLGNYFLIGALFNLLLILVTSTPACASTIATHLGAGLIIGELVDNPTEAFAYGVLAHIAFDKFDQEYMIHWEDMAQDRDIITVDAICSILAIAKVMREKDPAKKKVLIASLLGSVAPDLIEVIYRACGAKKPLFPWHYWNGKPLRTKQQTVRLVICSTTFSFGL